MRGALLRVLSEGDPSVPGGSVGGKDPRASEQIADLVAQLREARALLREQDVIMLAAIFDK